MTYYRVHQCYAKEGISRDKAGEEPLGYILEQKPAIVNCVDYANVSYKGHENTSIYKLTTCAGVSLAVSRHR
jgi:hypothetical protein